MLKHIPSSSRQSKQTSVMQNSHGTYLTIVFFIPIIMPIGILSVELYYDNKDKSI